MFACFFIFFILVFTLAEVLYVRGFATKWRQPDQVAVSGGSHAVRTLSCECGRVGCAAAGWRGGDAYAHALPVLR